MDRSLRGRVWGGRHWGEVWRAAARPRVLGLLPSPSPLPPTLHHSNHFSRVLPLLPRQPGKAITPPPGPQLTPPSGIPLAPPCILIPAEKALVGARPLGLSRHRRACPPTFPGTGRCFSLREELIHSPGSHRPWPPTGAPHGRGQGSILGQTQTCGPGTGTLPTSSLLLDGLLTTEEPEIPSSQPPQKPLQGLNVSRTQAEAGGGRAEVPWATCC